MPHNHFFLMGRSLLHFRRLAAAALNRWRFQIRIWHLFLSISSGDSSHFIFFWVPPFFSLFLDPVQFWYYYFFILFFPNFPRRFATLGTSADSPDNMSNIPQQTRAKLFFFLFLWVLTRFFFSFFSSLDFTRKERILSSRCSTHLISEKFKEKKFVWQSGFLS